MSAFRPSSSCDRILLDASLFPDETELIASAGALRESLTGRELHLLSEGDLPGAEGSGLFADVVETGGLPIDLEQLGARLEATSTLIVTQQERIVAWARQKGLAVHKPADTGELQHSLSLSSLVMRDTTALLLRAKRHKEDRPFLVGVNGMSKSGKSSFAARLAAQLEGLGFETVLLPLDLFIAPKKVRRAKNYPEDFGHYRKYYAFDRLRSQILQPLQAGERVVEFDAYDLEREKTVEKRKLVLGGQSMLLIEGLYLYQEEFFSAFDFRIYLVTDFQKCVDLELEAYPEGKSREKRKEEFLRRELAAQSIYLRQESPWKRAHIVLRDVNDAQPKIESWQTEL